VGSEMCIRDRSMSMSDSAQASVRSSIVPMVARFGGVQLTIDVRVQCTPKDLDELGQKLRKVIRDFNESPEPEKKQSPPAATEGTEG